MALNAYLRVAGETQGWIRGGSTQAGREGLMEIYGMSHEVISPRDAASGLPTGKRQHKPISCTKPIDKATPLLMAALVTNETITEFRLDFYRPSRGGREERSYTIELFDAAIAGIRAEQLNNKYPENLPLEPREHVMFTYGRIVWTWQDGGITSEDSWRAGDD